MRRTLLIIDDDRGLCATLADALASADLEIVTATTLVQGLAVCRARQIDVVLLDQVLPDGEGAEICPAILRQDSGTKIIFMTAYPTFENAVAAVRHGAFDYLAKPLEIEALRLSVGNALRLRALEVVEELAQRGARQEAAQARLVGDSPGMQLVRDLCNRAAQSAAPVLITGETGTGKTMLAQYIHYRGTRSRFPFVAVNCAALPESLIESELFGHEKGAFTGATGARRGVFEMAGAGTVLLDEVGAMPLPLQAKLLGVLENRRFRRIGSEVERFTEARVIAATNTGLEEAVATGRFRQDLFFRLNVIRIEVPPLREHLEDLPELCTYLLAGMPGRSRSLASGELERLAVYRWPGNVRELRNLLERASILQPDNEISPSQFLENAPGPVESSTFSPGEVLTLAQVERRHIEQVLAHHGFNRTQTARALGISLSTLKRKLKEIGRR